MKHWRMTLLFSCVSLVAAACSDDGGDEEPEAGAATTEAAGAPGTTAAPEAPAATPAPDTGATTSQPVRSSTMPADASDGDGVFDGDDFYAVPEPLPEGEPGTLLRYEPIDLYGRWSSFYDHPYTYAVELTGSDGGAVVVYRDPLALRPDGEPDETVGQSAAELASWLAEHPALQPVTPTEVHVEGLDGFHLALALEPSFTDVPVDCPPDDVCSALLQSGDPVDAWSLWLWQSDDVAEVFLLDAADGGAVAIVIDPWDWAGTDADTFYAVAHELTDSFDFTAEAGDAGDAACPHDWGGTCHGWLTPGDGYSAIEFEPAFSYAAPPPQDGAAVAWRIMYLSESVRGEPIAVTGMAVIPADPRAGGDRPTVSVAHGTTGVGDECAPSKDARDELVDMTPFVNAGHIVTITDYEGLGTPGRHPYLVGVSEGRGVLDAVRAAAQLPDAHAGSEFAIWGHSQGGHAALWAGELAPEWTPELDLAGVVAGAPAAELELTGEGLDPVSIGFVMLAAAAYDAAYDDIDSSMVLTPSAIDQLDIVDDECAEEVLEHFAGQDPDDLLQPPGSSELWSTRLAENNPGQVRIDAPVLIVDAADDEIIPTEAIDTLHEQLCDLDQVVERRTVDGDHGDAWWNALQDGTEWIEQRFAGEQPTTTCP